MREKLLESARELGYVVFSQKKIREWKAKNKSIEIPVKEEKPESARSIANKQIRALKIERKACSLCGYVGKLAIHHRDKDKTNNDISNLEVLCFPCHREKHPELPAVLFNVA
jgi:5-methylcytosine-specific restriction endonuclease McrA